MEPNKSNLLFLINELSYLRVFSFKSTEVCLNFIENNEMYIVCADYKGGGRVRAYMINKNSDLISELTFPDIENMVLSFYFPVIEPKGGAAIVVSCNKSGDLKIARFTKDAKFLSLNTFR